MEKNTVWAIGLSTVVLVGFFAAQTFLFPPQKNQAQNEEQKTEVASSENPENASEVQNQAVGSDSTINTVESENIVAVADKSASGESSENLTEEKFTITTNKVAVTFTNRGGDIVSYELIEKDDRGTLKNRDADTGKGVELIENLSDKNRAFGLSLGGANRPIINDIFTAKKLDDYSIGFFKKFT